MTLVELEGLLSCPCCRGHIEGLDAPEIKRGYKCTSIGCIGNTEGFTTVQGQPILINWSESIISKEIACGINQVVPRTSGTQLYDRLHNIMFGENKAAARIEQRLLEMLARNNSDVKTVLIVGGGAIGSGMRRLYRSNLVSIVAFDVYPSMATDFVADAHDIPMIDQSVDAVWIQAVLEHVLSPEKVVSEIHRVLKPNGLVFSDTPFMQQVHEGAFDFTRFTLSGHRWLFRNFVELESGLSAGAGTALRWSIQYFAYAITNSVLLSKLAAAIFFWLRFLDPIGRKEVQKLGASGTYFFGQKSDTSMNRIEIVSYFSDGSSSSKAISGYRAA